MSRAGPPTVTSDTKPWERGNGESWPAYESFLIYRDLGAERSTAKVARQVAKARRTIERWCRAYEWVRRAEAWDWNLNDLKNRAQESEVVEMGKRQARAAQAMQAALQLPIQEFVRRYQADPTLLQKLSDEELLELLVKVPRTMVNAVNIERTARGLPSTLEPPEAEEAASRFKIVLDEPAKKKPLVAPAPTEDAPR